MDILVLSVFGSVRFLGNFPECQTEYGVRFGTLAKCRTEHRVQFDRVQFAIRTVFEYEPFFGGFHIIYIGF